MAMPKLAADQDVKNRVTVVGTAADGSPALDDVVVSFDRPGAGAYLDAVLHLGPLGASTEFSACDLATPGCAGPLRLTAALATSPSVPVATVDVEIVDPLEVNPARACLAGGDMFVLEGNDSVFTGTATITNATFQPLYGFQNYVGMRVTPSGGSDSWDLVYDGRVMTPVFIPDAYEDARKTYVSQSNLARDRPAMELRGFGHACDDLTGRFDIVEYTWDGNGPTLLTATFEQHCVASPELGVHGCVHWEKP